MKFRFSRRNVIYGAASAALARSFEMEAAAAPARQWPMLEAPDTPRLALALGDTGGPLPASMRPAAANAGAGNPAGPGRAGRGGGYGGYLEQKPRLQIRPPHSQKGEADSAAALRPMNASNNSG